MRKNKFAIILSMALALTNIVPVMAMEKNTATEVSDNEADVNNANFELTSTPINKVSGKDLVKNTLGRTLTIQDSATSLPLYVQLSNNYIYYEPWEYEIDDNKYSGVDFYDSLISVKSKKGIEDGYHLLNIDAGSIGGFCGISDDDDADGKDKDYCSFFGVNFYDSAKRQGYELREVVRDIAEEQESIRIETDSNGTEHVLYKALTDEQLEEAWKQTLEYKKNPYDDYTVSNNYPNTSITVGEFTITYPEAITFIKSKKAVLKPSDVTVSGPNGEFHPIKVKVRRGKQHGYTTFRMKFDESLAKDVRKKLSKEKIPIYIAQYTVSDSDEVILTKNKKGKVRKITVNGIKVERKGYHVEQFTRRRKDKLTGKENDIYYDGIWFYSRCFRGNILTENVKVVSK